MTKPNSVDAASLHPIVTRLRERSTGKDMWRVRDKDTGAYCIQFESWEQIEAHEWWRDHKDREFHKNHELARVRIQSQEDRLMQEAADMLEFFFGQMQMHSPKMDGQHSYRFRGSGWPMTHCVGPNAEDAVKAALQEIQRSRSESA
jgi:hypothetical protein